MPLFLERAFLAKLGAVFEMQKSIISFANIDDNVFYKMLQPHRGIHLATYIDISDDRLRVAVSQIDLGD